MAEQANEQQEALIPDEGATQQPDNAVDPDVELDIEELKAKAAKADEYKGFADRTAKENKELKKQLDPQKPLTTNQSSSDSDERFERLELKTENFSVDEVDFLMQNGGRKALDNKIVMAGIEAIRKAKKSTEATPSGTAKSAIYQKFTEQDLKRMSREELEKILPHG